MQEGESENTRVQGGGEGEPSLCGTQSQSVGYAPRLGRDRQGQPLPALLIRSSYWQYILFLRLFIYL